MEPEKPIETHEKATDKPLGLGVTDDTPPAQTEPQPRGVVATFREAFQRARESRPNRPSRRKPADERGESERSARNRDRTKTLFGMVAALVVLLIAFLGVFSSSQSDSRKEPATRRGQPNLGRPEDRLRAQGARSGSVTPLLSADLNANQQAPADQVSPEDIGGTARNRATGEVLADAGNKNRVAPKAGTGRGNNEYELGNVQFDDPALEAYRRQLQGSAPVPPQAAPVANNPPQPSPPPPPPVSPNRESDTLAKSSLVFVRSASPAPQAPLPPRAEPAFVEQRATGSLLPGGTRLLARLQTAVSTAVKTPVVAVIEAHYERDGEIVVPAGTKAIGELQSANRSGLVGIRFHTLQPPQGPTESIEGSAVSLQFSPLKGQVTGTNQGKQFLARALSGVGTVAAFAVGRPGGLSLSGPMDNSILLRERVAQNIGIAGEQELSSLAYSQDVVVTVPGNTRFYIVLQSTAGQAARPAVTPASSAPPSRPTQSRSDQLPSAAELSQLIALKQELNRMYRETGTLRLNDPAQVPSLQDR
jgi:hypothetical protein